MTTPRTHSATLTARTPEDVLAMVPYVLGFRPAHSLVMLTFGNREPTFHARVDLPADVADVPDVVEMLVDPARRHHVSQAVVVGYDDDASLCDGALRLLAAELAAAGVTVVEALRVTGRRWFPVPSTPESRGVEFDERSHPFAARAVLEGRVTHESRDDLAATLDPADRSSVARVGDAVLSAAHPSSDRPAEASWLRDTVAACLRDGTCLDDADAGRLLVGCHETEAREVVLKTMTRANAGQHVELWRDLLRRTPEGLQAVPGSLLAFAAWLTGDGALAWCALDRVSAADADDPLADCVARALDAALPPSVWGVDPAPPTAWGEAG